MAKQQQLEILKNIHEEAGQSIHFRPIASHKCRDSTYLKILDCPFLYSIYKDVEYYIKSCENCQK